MVRKKDDSWVEWGNDCLQLRNNRRLVESLLSIDRPFLSAWCCFTDAHRSIQTLKRILTHVVRCARRQKSPPIYLNGNCERLSWGEKTRRMIGDDHGYWATSLRRHQRPISCLLNHLVRVHQTVTEGMAHCGKVKRYQHRVLKVSKTMAKRAHICYWKSAFIECLRQGIDGYFVSGLAYLTNCSQDSKWLPNFKRWQIHIWACLKKVFLEKECYVRPVSSFPINTEATA